MRKVFLAVLACVLVLLSAGCNDFKFADWSDDDLSLTYMGNDYTSIATQSCEYSYDSSKMVFLFSIDYGEFNDMGESYNVYRHSDDDTPVYLFVIPQPSIRDATPLAYILKIKDSNPSAAPAARQA